MARKFAGGFIRFLNLFIRIAQLCASVIVLGIFSYFLAVLADHDMQIGEWMLAVEGMSGAATLYTLVASILTMPMGGIPFFAAVGMMLDVCFAAAFIAVAVLNRGGANSCSGHVDTPLGSGNANDHAPGYGKEGFGTGQGQNLTFMPNLGNACRLQKGSFAVAIIAIFLFLLSLFPQILLVRHRRKEKRFGATSNYTAGGERGGRSFWRFGRRRPDSGVDYATTGTPVGSYALRSSDEGPEPPVEKPQGRFAKFFSRGKKSDSTKFGAPQFSTPKYSRDDDDDMRNGYGYGNSAFAYANTKPAILTPTTSTGATSNGATAPPYASYGYGQSGIGNDDYAHGYGTYRPNY